MIYHPFEKINRQKPALLQRGLCGICTTKCKFDAIKLVWDGEYVSPKVEKIASHLVAGMAKRGGKIAIKTIKDTVKKLGTD